MAGFNGKWTLTSSDNAEAFYNAVKATDQFKGVLQSLASEVKTNPEVYVEELHVDKAANTVHRVAYIRGEKSKDLGAQTLGVEHDGRVYGKPAKVKAVLESDTKMVRYETGDDFNSVSTLEVHGNELILTQASGSVKSVEKYKRLS